MRMLEEALLYAEFSVDASRVWRWRSVEEDGLAEVKFELLADDKSAPPQAIVEFGECTALGAVNLPGTGFAARDDAPLFMRSKIGGATYGVQVNVAQTARFLLVNTAAARGRRAPKDWYDIAFVLLHKDDGDPKVVADLVRPLCSTDCGAVEVNLGGRQLVKGVASLAGAIHQIALEVVGAPASRLVVIGTGPVVVPEDGTESAPLSSLGPRPCLRSDTGTPKVASTPSSAIVMPS